MTFADIENVIKNELSSSGIKSIILIGSRATDDFIRADSDYDLYVVTPIYAIPFLFSFIKRKEKKLQEKLGCEVSVAPLTVNRIKHGKDLLIFKTKKEGITLSGKDYLSEIGINSLKEIDMNELFSYLFSSIYFLIRDFSTSFKNNECKDVKFQYYIAKSLLYSFETQLYSEGIYINKKEDIFKKSIIKHQTNKNISKAINKAKKIIGGESFDSGNNIQFWFVAREIAIMVFRDLLENYYKQLSIRDNSIETLIDYYKFSGYSLKKNFQYGILSFINNFNIPFNAIFNKKSIERHFHSSLFYLLLSIKNDLSINEHYLFKAKKNLLDIGITLDYNGDDIELIWEQIKHIITDYWSMANSKNII